MKLSSKALFINVLVKLDPRIIKLLPNGCKNLHTNWGLSRACVQTGPALYHVIYMNTRT